MGFVEGRRFAAALAVAGACVFGASNARAQHVVTDSEAAKLTFAALTAPPPPPRPVWRGFVHRASARGYAFRDRGWSAHRGGRGTLWTEASAWRRVSHGDANRFFGAHLYAASARHLVGGSASRHGVARSAARHRI